MMPNIRYASFMLRLQWTQNDDRPTWLVSMQSTKTGELRWFPSLEALIQFLRDEYGSCEGVDDWAAPDVKPAFLEKEDSTPANR